MRSVRALEGHSARIFSIALSCLPDGRRIAASASHDRTVKVWSLDDHQLLHSIEYSDFVWRVFIVTTPRPLVIAFVSTEDKIQVSNLLTGETESVFFGRLIFAGTVPGFARPVIVVSAGEEDLAFLDVCTGSCLRLIRGGFEKAFRAVVASGSPSVPPSLIFTTWNAQNRRSTIQTYDLSLEDYAQTVVDREKPKMALLFEGDSRDGVTSLVVTQCSRHMICSGHYDGMVRLWSIETRQLLMALEGHMDYIGSVAAWRGREHIVVSGSSDGTIKAWDTNTGACLATGEGHTRDVWAVAVSHGPKPLIVSGSFDRSVRLWDLNSLLADAHWARRRSFCIAVRDILSGRLTSAAETSENRAALRALHVQSLCALVASFL